MSHVISIKPHNRVRAAMDIAGYNQEMLAKAMGLGINTMNLKLNGKRQFTLGECNRIAKALGTTLDKIFFDNDVPE